MIKSIEPVLVDTCLLIFYFDKEHPKHAKTRDFLESLSDQGFAGVVALQNILELYRVVTTSSNNVHTVKPKVIDSFIKGVLLQLFDLITPDYNTYLLFSDHSIQNSIVGRKVFDIFLAVTAKANGVSVIATENETDFSSIKSLKMRTISPFKNR